LRITAAVYNRSRHFVHAARSLRSASRLQRNDLWCSSDQSDGFQYLKRFTKAFWAYQLVAAEFG
jgi:hypothetical protein